MQGLRSAWVSILCAFCCWGVMIFSMISMAGSILGISIQIIGNVMTVTSFIFLSWAHFRYWHKNPKTKADTWTLLFATATVSIASVVHLIM